MPDKQTQMQKDAEFRILQLLKEEPQLSQRELAEQVGVSLDSANYAVKALVHKGTIKAGNFAVSPNKRGYAYSLTPKDASQNAQLVARFLERKRAEYFALKQEIERLEGMCDVGSAIEASGE